MSDRALGSEREYMEIVQLSWCLVYSQEWVSMQSETVWVETVVMTCDGIFRSLSVTSLHLWLSASLRWLPSPTIPSLDHVRSSHGGESI